MKPRLHESLLIARAQSGDRVAFEELLLLGHPILLRYVTGMIGRELADDALQDTFLQIYRKLSFRTEPLAFRAWAYRVATRLALARLKRERRWREQIRDEDLLQNLPAPPRLDQAHNVLLELEELAKHVSPKSRAVLLMHYREEISLEEIAIILDIPLGTAKSRLAYGLSSLRILSHCKGAKQ